MRGPLLSSTRTWSGKNDDSRESPFTDELRALLKAQAKADTLFQDRGIMTETCSSMPTASRFATFGNLGKTHVRTRDSVRKSTRVRRQKVVSPSRKLNRSVFGMISAVAPFEISFAPVFRTSGLQMSGYTPALSRRGPGCWTDFQLVGTRSQERFLSCVR